MAIPVLFSQEIGYHNLYSASFLDCAVQRWYLFPSSSPFKRRLHGSFLLCPVKEASQKMMQGNTLMESMVLLCLLLLEKKTISRLFLCSVRKLVHVL